MISFNTISASILTPGQYIEFDSSRAVRGTPQIPHKILVIGQRLNTGTLAALTPSRVRSDKEGELMSGRGSIGAAMIAAAKAANPYTDMHFVGVDDIGGSIAATGTITVTGAATAAGVIALYIGGKKVAVAVAAASTQNQTAAAIAAAINADTSLPVSATVVANVVTLTARNKGAIGNDIDARLNYNTGDALPAGVAVAIVAMSGGATNPNVSTALAALGDTAYQTIITPWTDATNLAALEAFLEARWGGMEMKEAQAFAGAAGSYAQIDTLVNSRNSLFLSIMSSQKSPTPPWVIAAVVGAIDAGQAESATNCNRPRQTLPLTGVLPPKETDRYTRTERNQMLTDGGATFVVDEGGVCRIERLVTTYKTSNGAPDPSYRDLETIRCLAYLRYSTRARIALKYPRHKLASNGTSIPPGQPIVTPNDVRDELITLFMEWQDAGLVEGLEQFKSELIVERNANDADRVDAIIPPDVINGFRVFAAQVQFRL